MTLVPPIFIDNRIDGLLHFATIDALEWRFEPWYVHDEPFTAFDSEGRLVDLVVEERAISACFGLRERTVELVTARSREDEPEHADELRATLTADLERGGAQGVPWDGLSLSELVAQVVCLPGD